MCINKKASFPLLTCSMINYNKKEKQEIEVLRDFNLRSSNNCRINNYTAYAICTQTFITSIEELMTYFFAH